jgi:hypothetical protein
MKKRSAKKVVKKTTSPSRLGRSPLGPRTSVPRPEVPPPEKTAPTVSRTGASEITIPPEHYHEKLLRLYAAAVVDHLEELGRHRGSLSQLAELVGSEVVAARELCRRKLALLPASRCQKLRDDRIYALYRALRENLAVARENLEDHVGYFIEAYRKASGEVGEPQVQGMLLAMHTTYLSGPSAFAVVWKELVELLESRGVPITFPR